MNILIIVVEVDLMLFVKLDKVRYLLLERLIIFRGILLNF